MHKMLEKYVNNDFDETEIDKSEAEKLGRLLFFLEYSASIREPKFNPYFAPKYNFDIINNYSTEELSISNFFVFFINISHSLVLSYTDSGDFYIGKLDTLSNKDKFKHKELTIIQKYVIIARLLSCFLNEIEIKSKAAFNIAFHYIVMRFIDKSEAEAHFLNNSDVKGILVSRGFIFLLSKFRTPVSPSEMQNIYANIKKLYQDPEPLEKFYGIKAWERYLESRKSLSPKPDRSDKIWTKSFFLTNIKKYKNQSEFAKALGISTQRVSFMKKRLRISQSFPKK